MIKHAGAFRAMAGKQLIWTVIGISAFSIFAHLSGHPQWTALTSNTVMSLLTAISLVFISSAILLLVSASSERAKEEKHDVLEAALKREARNDL